MNGKIVREWAIQEGRGSRILVEVDTPVTFHDDEGEEQITFHVQSSAVHADHSGPEVLIFPSDPAGEIISWMEIYGERGTLDHREVLANWGCDLRKASAVTIEVTAVPVRERLAASNG